MLATVGGQKRHLKLCSLFLEADLACLASAKPFNQGLPESGLMRI